MLLDIVMILFLIFMSYCMYILVIIPYQERRKEDLETFDRYVKALNHDKQALADKMSINDLT